MQAHLPLITVLYAGLNGLVAVFLATQVSRHRLKHGVDLGDGGNTGMTQAIRAHGNNAEYVPLILLVLALIEMAGAPASALHVFGVALTAGRVLHAQGIYSNPGRSFGRLTGTTVTWLVLGLSCFYALYLFAVGGRV